MIDCERLVDEGKMGARELAGVKGRADVVSAVCLAEIAHFHQERVYEFKAVIQQYLEMQRTFFSSVSAVLFTTRVCFLTAL